VSPLSPSPLSPDDPRWVWIIYGLLFVPFVGPATLVVGSSVLYYRWRGKYPEAATRLNRRAWIAIGLNVSAHLLIARVRG
jgi:hypothetical protein